jgi:hypothetical protein
MNNDVYTAQARALFCGDDSGDEEAKPLDATDPQWDAAMRGLRTFLASGHADAALRLGWPHDELFAVRCGPTSRRRTADRRSRGGRDRVGQDPD